MGFKSAEQCVQLLTPASWRKPTVQRGIWGRALLVEEGPADGPLGNAVKSFVGNHQHNAQLSYCFVQREGEIG